MDPTFRLRTATRLHFLLLRRFGQDIDVNILLKATAHKHDGLWLCKATGDAELIRLAHQLGRANRLHAEMESRLREDQLASAREAELAAAAAAALNHHAAGGAASQPMPWSGNTTGFGVTHPLELNPVQAATRRQPAQWLNPMHWIKNSRRGHNA